ncbi:S-locus glycoprotein domain [Dillenia turbinata]|uniref:S-locus glycoprotein domain n=1 Tax=Dillenia turbinata TaxID=194707 RepID=A0AAN8UVA6_9MAGN
MECYTLFCITLLFTSFTFFPTNSISLDIITPAHSLKDGDTLVSSGEQFELGFFSPRNSKSRYVGIWYKQISERTVVWVANRDNPLNDSSGILKLDDYGNVILINQAEDVIWSSNHSSIAKAVDPISQILDSGNFIIREENDSNSDNYIWQSFDYPTDTLLPGMKLGWNLKTGLDRVITSWRSSEDPAQGEFSFKVDYSGSPEIYLLRKQEREYRSGPWNGYRFSGVPEMQPEYLFNFSFVSNSEEVYYSFRVLNGSVLSRLIVHHTGVLKRLTWIETIRSWSLFWYAPKDQCDTYKVCGAYSICDPNNSPVCECMRGFSPKNPQAWFLRDGSGGCVRKTGLKCDERDGFLRLKDVKLPDTSKVFIDENMSLKECEEMCRRNCSCTGYANSGIVGGGSGCIIWFDELVDVRDYAEGGQELFVRVAASDLGKF